MKSPKRAFFIYIRKGGSMSKKQFKECAGSLLGLKPSESGKEQLKAMGIKSKDMTNKMLLIAVLFEKALKGDVPAIKELRSLAEEDEQSRNEENEALSLEEKIKRIEALFDEYKKQAEV